MADTSPEIAARTAAGSAPPRPAPEARETFMAMERPELIERYRLGIDAIDPRAFELPADLADRAFDAASGLGSWSSRMLMNHVADAEVVSVVRIRRALAEDGPVLADWDHEAFLASPLYGPGAGACAGTETGRGTGAILAPMGVLAATIYTTRQWMAATFYQLDEAAWQRSAMHPRRGPMTVREIAAHMAWHLEHHLSYLNAKVESMLGPRPADDEACGHDAPPEGGCGSGCGCVGGG